MSVYTAESSFGWLDHDSTASERVSTLLRSLEEPSTLDALGLGAVRDAFSTMLSPGTSTVQTRLRYFIFLPWIFDQLERDRVSPADFAPRLRNTEARLIDRLRPLGPNLGVIGYTAGRDLKRLPSEVYWGGLGSWGIRKRDISRADYGRQLRSSLRARPERDDDGNVTSRSLTMWTTMPEAPDDFLDADITFDLTVDESRLLMDHIRTHQPGTLLAVMTGATAEQVDVDFPWELPTAGMPDRLVETLHHAQCFAELTVGPQHVYNVLLARQARNEFGWDTSELEARELQHLETWAGVISNRYSQLQSWASEIAAFWRFLDGVDSVIVPTQEFVTAMISRALQDPAEFAEDPWVHERVRDREIRLKSKRARLGSRSALESWNQVPFGGQLNYRWPITKSYLTDMAAGLGAGN